MVVEESWDGATGLGLHSVCGRPPRDLEPGLSGLSRGRRSPAPVSAERRASRAPFSLSGGAALRVREGETAAEEMRAMSEGNRRELRRAGTVSDCWSATLLCDESGCWAEELDEMLNEVAEDRDGRPAGGLPGEEALSMTEVRSESVSRRCCSSLGEGSVRKSEGEEMVGWKRSGRGCEDIGHQDMWFRGVDMGRLGLEEKRSMAPFTKLAPDQEARICARESHATAP